MRPPVNAARVRELARQLGRASPSRVRIYLTGGATAVLEGWRETTIDIDLRFEPETIPIRRLSRSSNAASRTTSWTSMR
jgi:hypothetical protein